MAQQLPLPLTMSPSFTREALVETSCNAQALAMINSFPAWDALGMVLVGHAGSGKTHLGHVWAQKAGAVPFSELDMGAGRLPNVWVDDAQQEDEAQLFHLLNLAKEHNTKVLLACSEPVEVWARLPDLHSRLKSLPTVVLDVPDDEALAKVLEARCHAQGLALSPEAVYYLLGRMERSYTGVNVWVEKIHHEALAQKRLVTVPFLSALFNKEQT